MRIAPNETEIVGSWAMANGHMTEDEASLRITSLIETELQHLATSNDGWEKLYRDPQDGRYWELTYIHSDMQCGGPRALVLADLRKALDKYGISIDPLEL
jgi:hypothetical protein